jgi:hypothetical protein
MRKAATQEPSDIDAGGGKPHTVKPFSVLNPASSPIVPVPSPPLLPIQELVPLITVDPVEPKPSNMDPKQELDALETTQEYWGATHRPPNIHIGMQEEFRIAFVSDYDKDVSLRKIWHNSSVEEGNWCPGQRFFKNSEGLLFFRDADYISLDCASQLLGFRKS